ncbi:MAG: YkgJ family cysteine cluster protein [Phycisphaerae bacterium]|nr:YkgJ family cysteine cluster protein [Phycisphaerae bacterium]
MKLNLSRHISEKQKYSCICCGRGCRAFLVPVGKGEREAIENLAYWPEELGTKDIFGKSSLFGKNIDVLSKRANTDCVFLDRQDQLCIIHKRFGFEAKPLACQLFPVLLTPFAGELRVGLRFDCPGVCNSDGESIQSLLKDARRLATKLIPAGALKNEPPEIWPGVKVLASRFDLLNETMLGVLRRDDIDLIVKLHWLRRFADNLTVVRWDILDEEEACKVTASFSEEILTEECEAGHSYQNLDGRVRKMLGQIFFFLSYPSDVMAPSRTIFQNLINQIKTSIKAHKLNRPKGKLYPIQKDWPNCDKAILEYSFGSWPEDVKMFIVRYLTCRISGLNYCGQGCYGYSMAEGINQLLLAIGTTGWLMRIHAVKAGRNEIVLADAHAAIITIDGNLGYAKPLGMGPAKLRLNYLSGYLEEIINCYCL